MCATHTYAANECTKTLTYKGQFSRSVLVALTDHGTIGRWNYFLGAWWQLYACPACLKVVWDNCGIVAGCPCQPTTIPRLLLQITHHRALRHHTNGQYVTNLQGCYNYNNTQLPYAILGNSGCLKALTMFFSAVTSAWLAILPIHRSVAQRLLTKTRNLSKAHETRESL